jgi:hypothetical protein
MTEAVGKGKNSMVCFADGAAATVAGKSFLGTPMLKHSNGIGIEIMVLLQIACLATAAENSGSSRAVLTTQPAKARHEGIPERDPNADPRLIDLTDYYTLALGEDASGVFGYTLDMLPKGVHRVGNVQYDLRGVVQVWGQPFGGRAKKKFPEQVKAIRVGLKCRKLMFLHASRWTEDKVNKIGSYVIHYADGKTAEVPIVFGKDLRDWRPVHDPGAGGPAPAWQGCDKAGEAVVLFETAWTNPKPEAQIASIDMVSAMMEAAPFLVALTAD